MYKYKCLILATGILVVFSIFSLDSLAAIEQLTDDIKLLIQSGETEQADIKIEQLKSDNSSDLALPDSLLDIAYTYRKAHKAVKADENYRFISSNFAGTWSGIFATLQVDKYEIQTLIKNEDYSLAELKLDALKDNYSGNADLEGAIFDVMFSYRRACRYDDHKQLCQYFLDNYPRSNLAESVALWIRTYDITDVISGGNYDTAETMTDQLILDFAKASHLPDRIYDIARAFKRSGEIQYSNDFYQYIIINYPESPAAKNASLQITNDEVLYMIDQGSYVQAGSAVEQMKVDFASSPSISNKLYHIADRFQRSGESERAKALYQYILDNYPDCSCARSSGLFVNSFEINDVIARGSYDMAIAKTEQLQTDFADSPYLSGWLYGIAGNFYRAGQTEKAKNTYQYIVNNFSGSVDAENASLWINTFDIKDLISGGNYTQAEEAIYQLKADFSDISQLPGNLYILADEFDRTGQINTALDIYEYIVNNYPNSSKALISGLYINSHSIGTLIEQGNYEQAREAVTQLRTDFTDNPYLADSLYGIAGSFWKEGQRQSSKDIHQYIVNNFSNEAVARSSEFILKRMDISEMIEVGNYIDADFKIAELRKNDFDNDLLSAALFDFGQHYESLSDIETAKTFYNEIVIDCPDSCYAVRSELKLRRITIDDLIKSGNYQTARSEVIRLKEDFPDNDLLKVKHELMVIAFNYTKAGQVSSARELYQEIINISPESRDKNVALLRLNMLDYFSHIDSGETSLAENVIVMIENSMRDTQYLPLGLFIIAEEYYRRGTQQQTMEPDICLQKAIDICENKVLTNALTDEHTKAECYMILAGAHRYLGNYTVSSGYYQLYADNFPQRRQAWYSRLMIGRNHEELITEDTVDSSQAKDVIVSEYTKLIEDYPNSKGAKIAKQWLNRNQ